MDSMLQTAYSRTSIAQISSAPQIFVLDMGSSSHWGFIMTPGQETNGNNLGNSFDLLYNNGTRASQ